MGKHCSAAFDHLKTVIFALQAEIHRDQRMWACRGPQERSRTPRVRVTMQMGTWV